jgi:hypothetical protein
MKLEKIYYKNLMLKGRSRKGIKENNNTTDKMDPKNTLIEMHSSDLEYDFFGGSDTFRVT